MIRVFPDPVFWSHSARCAGDLGWSKDTTAMTRLRGQRLRLGLSRTPLRVLMSSAGTSRTVFSAASTGAKLYCRSCRLQAAAVPWTAPRRCSGGAQGHRHLFHELYVARGHHHAFLLTPTTTVCQDRLPRSSGRRHADADPLQLSGSFGQS